MSTRRWSVVIRTPLLLPLILLVLLDPTVALGLPPDRTIGQYAHRTWGVDDGLPHGTVRAVAQTPDGYLWLGTYEGLVRFNGFDFVVFDKTTTPALKNNSIIALHVAPDGALWIGTNGGLTRYKDDSFRTFTRREGLAHESIYAIADDGHGGLWIGSNGGGVQRMSGDRFERPAALDELSRRSITSLVRDGRGVLWIGTTGAGVGRYDGTLRLIDRADGLSSDSGLSLLPDADGSVLVGTSSGVDRLSGATVEMLAPGALPREQITALRRDADGSLWIGTYSHGLFRLAASKVAGFGVADGLRNASVRTIFEDTNGSLWVGTNRGVEQFRRGAFITYTTDNGLQNDFVRSVFEDRSGGMWFGTANGLTRLDASGVKNFGVADGLTTPYIFSIAQSSDGHMWFGSTNGLFRFDGTRFRRLSTTDGLSNNAIRAIHEDQNGELWIGTDHGINVIGRDGAIRRITVDGNRGGDYVMAIAELDGRIFIAMDGGGLGYAEGNRLRLVTAPDDLPTNHLFALQPDEGRTLWIATDGDGLLRYRDGEIRRITSRNGLHHDKILSFADDGRGHLWFGSSRGVFSIAKEELNAVADGTMTRLTSRVFDESDGLRTRQCDGAAQPAAWRARDGRLWFATAEGAAVVAPRDAFEMATAAAPDAVIEQVRADGEELKTSDGAIRLAAGVSRLEIEYAGIAFRTPDRVHFRYRLEGYDGDWIEAGRRRVASYTNLAPGDYRFVVAAGSDGRWANEAAVLRLELPPRLHQKRWFVGLIVAAVAGLLLALHLLRVRVGRRREERLRAMVDDRTRELVQQKERAERAFLAAEAAQRESERHEKLLEQALVEAEAANRAKSTFLATTSHELRTPLNAIIGFSDILNAQVSEKLAPRYVQFLQNINASGQYLLGIINNILDLSKIEAGKMEVYPEPLVVRDVVNGITAVMKGVTAPRGIEISVDVPGDLPKIEADPVHMKQILYNLMSNAVKFSPDGSSVEVSARHIWPKDSAAGEHSIEIRVTDHGIGISASDQERIFQEFTQAHGSRKRPQGTGLGLALVRRFVELHNGSIRVESCVGEGSTFFVVIPCRWQARRGVEGTVADPLASA